MRDTATVLDASGDGLHRVATEPGWTGASADAAAALFGRQAARMRRNADEMVAAAREIAGANADLADARARYNALPISELSPTEFASVAAGGWVVLGPFGAFTGLAGAAFANAVLDFNRESAARRILGDLAVSLAAREARISARTADIESPPYGRPASIPVFAADRPEGDMSPWELGWEWLTGAGNHRDFVEGDAMVDLLRQHPFYVGLREGLQEDYDDLYVGYADEALYSLQGVDGVGKYIVDYSTLVTGGATGNLAVTYLGSHGVQLEVIGQRPDGGYEVRFTVHNTSSLQSATRPPVIGYQDWYLDTVGTWTNDFAEATGFGRQTSQTLTWTETIYP